MAPVIPPRRLPVDDDFDLESLAAYLHLQVEQVVRLVERGKVPGRRVAGGWRFSPGEIHHWLEARIGASDELELRVPVADVELVTLAELMPLSAIEVPLAARTRNSVITSMVDIAHRTGWLWDPESMAEAVRAREDLHPTTLETGVALLHPRRPLATMLERPLVAYGRTERGMPFASQRGQLTDLYFLVCSTTDRQHLRTLARLSRMLAEPLFLETLRGADDARRSHELLLERDSLLN
jgi:nitrogen PTS system EIIA component